MARFEKRNGCASYHDAGDSGIILYAFTAPELRNGEPDFATSQEYQNE